MYVRRDARALEFVFRRPHLEALLKVATHDFDPYVVTAASGTVPLWLEALNDVGGRHNKDQYGKRLDGRDKAGIRMLHHGQSSGKRLSETTGTTSLSTIIIDGAWLAADGTASVVSLLLRLPVVRAQIALRCSAVPVST